IALSADRELAEAKARELILERDMRMLGLDDSSGMETPLTDVRDRYLQDLATRAVPEHLRNVTSRLDYVVGAISAKRVCDLTPIELLQYRAKRLSEGASARTCNLDTDSMRAMLRWAKRVGICTENPIENLPRLKETDATKRCRRRALSEQDIER